MRRTAGLLVLTVLLAACGGGEVAEDGAAAAVQEFYEAMNAGKYGAAEALYGEEALAMLSDPNFAEENAFAVFADSETKQGTMTEVRIIDTEVAPNGTNVSFEVSYRSGPPVQRRVLVTEEGGTWKLGLISGS